MALRSFCVLVCVLTACAANHSKGPDEDDEDDDGGTTENETGAAPDGPACFAHETTAEIAATSVDDIDLVFVVDNSESMRDEQASLSAQFPRLIKMLTSGDIDDDGAVDFPGAKSLHLAVVSSDLGLPGITGVAGCDGLGDNGIFRNVASPEVAGCSAQTYEPPFLSFDREADDTAQTATDLGCMATLGLDGCTIEQPLESLLKALWPAADQTVTFVTDSNDEGGFGQAGPGAPNGEFDRGVRASSVLAMVVVTDEEDCSMRRVDFLAPGASPNSIDTRCFFEAQRGEDSSLFQLVRYIDVLKILRPGQESLVIFGGIVGVPARLATPEVVSQFDLVGNPDAFYDMLLSAPEMQEMVDDKGTPAVLDDDAMRPSCDRGADAKAFPPRRIVQVAKGFGANGFIQSICQDDFTAPIDVLVQTIAKQLGAVCLPRPIERNSDGLVGCDVTWELSPIAQGNALTSCSARPFLSDTGRVGNIGGPVCEVAQLSVGDDHELDGDGWFYDDFSELTQQACLGDTKQRISFTSGAEPPFGTVVKLNCFQTEYFAGDIDELDDLDDGDNDPAPFPLDCEEDADCPSQWFCDASGDNGTCSPGDICSAGPSSAHPEKVGDPCFSLIVPEGGFDDSEAYVEGNSPYCNDGACLVFHLAGDPRPDCSLRGSIAGEATNCANPQEVASRVYCSCRCDSPEGYAECQCPDGYSCVDVLDNAPPEIAGGYCVRDGTVTSN